LAAKQSADPAAYTDAIKPAVIPAFGATYLTAQPAAQRSANTAALFGAHWTAFRTTFDAAQQKTNGAAFKCAILQTISATLFEA
jgi:hypothetical protein